MIITTNLLYRDTINFLKLKWFSVLNFVFLSSFLTIIIDSIFTPHIDFLSVFYSSKLQEHYSLFDFINTLTFRQKKILLIASISRALSLLIGNTFLLGNLIVFIKTISKKNNKDTSILNNMFKVPFNRVFLLLIIITLVTQLGLILFIIPGIFLLILLSISPIILLVEKKTIIDSLYSSINTVINYYKIIVPAVISWLFLKCVILFIFSYIQIFPEYIKFFLLNFCMNVISSILIIYLFRFHMLIVQSAKTIKK